MELEDGGSSARVAPHSGAGVEQAKESEDGGWR
jgi:hypothetical protein